MAIGRFYGMVSALIRRASDGRYLMLRRSADKDFGAGTWECVTGRVDQGESFAEAVHREVREELGLSVKIEYIIGTVHMYRGTRLAENEMLGVQYCCAIGESPLLTVSWEHAEHRWVTAEEATALLPEAHWLLGVIRHAEAIRALAPVALLDYYRANDLL